MVRTVTGSSTDFLARCSILMPRSALRLVAGILASRRMSSESPEAFGQPISPAVGGGRAAARRSCEDAPASEPNTPRAQTALAYKG